MFQIGFGVLFFLLFFFTLVHTWQQGCCSLHQWPALCSSLHVSSLCFQFLYCNSNSSLLMALKEQKSTVRSYLIHHNIKRLLRRWFNLFKKNTQWGYLLILMYKQEVHSLNKPSTISFYNWRNQTFCKLSSTLCCCQTNKQQDQQGKQRVEAHRVVCSCSSGK